MREQLLELLGFVSAGLGFVWLSVGFYVFQRYGYDGTLFVLSRQFPAALAKWQQSAREGENHGK